MKKIYILLITILSTTSILFAQQSEIFSTNGNAIKGYDVVVSFLEGTHKSPTQIETWTVLNDKLYFNYNLKVKEYWNKKQDSLIQKADTNWQPLKKL